MSFKILIIEDEKNISEIVAKYLEKEGYTTPNCKRWDRRTCLI